MSDVFIGVTITLLKGLSFVYDVISYVPFMILDNPYLKVKQSNRIKARPVSEAAGAPWRTVDSFNELTTTLYPECSTLDDLFVRAVRLYGPRPCLGTRQLISEEDEVQPNGKVFKKVILASEYEWETFEQINRRVSHLGSGLLALGQKPRHNICLFAETRAEWIICAEACFKYNFPVVTLYATLGQEAIVHGINESEVSFVITTGELLPKFKDILSRMPKVEHLVYMEQPGGKKVKLDGFPTNVQVHSLNNVEEMGRQPENISTPVTKPTREDIAVIMYTSGSTGIPKGVVISHGNLMSGMSGQCQRVPELWKNAQLTCSTYDIYIGYLPLAHVLELSAELSVVAHGASIGYSSPLTLSDNSSKIKKGCKGDATVLKPTLMAAVPVIMDRIYKAVWEKVNEGGKFSKALFTFAYGYKLKKIEAGYDTPLFNQMVFKKTRAALGGNVRFMLSGGAPLSPDTQRFMNICMCCPVGQGYGLTETCGAGTVHESTDFSTGRVGAPLQCNEILLRDWEEGGYRTTDRPNPRGEILIGGGNVSMGYYKMPEKSKEDFLEIKGRRYFCTGDIGMFYPDGSLAIIDRKKDLVKLQAGEYVSLGKVEAELKLSPFVENICVYGDPMQNFTVALVVPNPKTLKNLAQKLNLDPEDTQGLCDNNDIEREVLYALHNQAKQAKLERFEIPQRIRLCHELWTPDTGLVTDAFKLKRKNIHSHYKNDINRMYA